MKEAFTEVVRDLIEALGERFDSGPGSIVERAKRDRNLLLYVVGHLWKITKLSPRVVEKLGNRSLNFREACQVSLVKLNSSPVTYLFANS